MASQETIVIKKTGKELRDGDVINIAPPYQEIPVWSSIVEIIPIFAPVGHRVWACKDFSFQFNIFHGDVVRVKTQMEVI